MAIATGVENIICELADQYEVSYKEGERILRLALSGVSRATGVSVEALRDRINNERGADSCAFLNAIIEAISMDVKVWKRRD